jgi:hypothetical protein
MKIGEHTITTMKELAGELLDTYQDAINKAFIRAGDESLKVSISFGLDLSKMIMEAVDVDATISFTAEKVKEKVTRKGVSEVQVEIPGVIK